jgi:glycosyltransferase involved in cell wall biosynthesis
VVHYFGRFGFYPPLLEEAPHPHLGMIVVIPCYNEPNLLASLNALWRCDRPERAVEVIVVINSSETSSPEILQQNRSTLDEARLWAREDCDRYFRVHFIDAPLLPRKHAGVGLARKIGMDEALYRADSLDQLDLPIVCFDADSTCDANYLVELERYFAANPKSPGCSLFFEHPLEHDAIILYELHLRYYVEALRFAAFPHAFHTIGSSMAVRARDYMKQGGMNKRQAGEDFYFLHKIIPLGGFGEINTTRVIPSPRASDRVPFGTGRAVRDFAEDGKLQTYPLQAFHDLKQLFAMVPALRASIDRVTDLSAPLQQFLTEQGFSKRLAEIRTHTNTVETFRARFFRWFDGFLAMKYIHHARDTAYGPAEVRIEAHRLIESIETSAVELLLEYRARQRQVSPTPLQ